MRSLVTYRSFAALTIVVISAALLVAVWDRHGAGIAARGSSLNLPPAMPAPVLTDDFDDNAVNTSLWTTEASGGPTIAETNQRVEVTLPATSAGSFFFARYNSIWELHGDFDVQVDFELLTWPPANGVRIGLITFDTGSFAAMDRISLGASGEFPGQPREVYITDFGDGLFFNPGSDLFGKLRLVRVGTTLTGYYFSGGAWMALHSRTVTIGDARFQLQAWSHDASFSDQQVKVAFDNFTVNQGQALGLSCASPPSGLVNWWPGDGHAIDVADSNNGTVQGATFAPGKVGQGFKFDPTDGSADYVSIPDSPIHKPANISVEAWVKFDALDTPGAFFPGGQYIVFKKNSRPFDFYEAYTLVKYRDAFGDRISFGISSASGVQKFAVSAPTIVTGQYYHVVGTYDFNGTSGTVKLYLNGVLHSATTANFPIDYGTRPLFIGAHPEGGTANLQGVVDEVSIYNRALSASEIQTIYNAGRAGKCKNCTPPPTGMVSWWPGDGNANDIKDSNHGTLQSGAGFGAGLVGQAFSLDGVNDYVDLGNATNLRVSSGDFTVDTWVRFNALDGDRSILDKMSAGGVNVDGWRLLKQGDGRFWFCLGGRTGNRCFDPAFTVFSTTRPSTGAWFHVAAVKTSTSFSIYVNGQLEDTRSPVPNFLDSHSANLRIGSYILEGSFLGGQVDEVEIHNRALTTAEISAIAKAGSAGKCKNRTPVAMCQSVTVSAGPSCTADASINNGSSDPDSDPITITQSPPGPYPLGTTSVTMTVTDSKGALSSCTATVTVVDTTPPQVTPSANASYQCLSQVPPGNPSQATATDNCSTPTITVADASNGGAGSIASPLVITRVFTATDAAGNSASAYQTITVIDNTPPVPDLAALPDVVGQCSATISAAPTATDNCRGSVTGTTSDPLSYSSQGTFIVNWTYNDGNGNTSTQTQKVIVKDTIAPTITTANKTENTAPGLCSAFVAHGTTASDNCALASLAGVRSDGGALSAPYPRGTTTINWTATDQAGNTSTATQTITVIDNIPPVITACATNKTVSVNAACQGAIPNLTGEVGATDNCTASSALTITQAPAAGTLVGLGATPVTITVKDATGNMSTCAVTVNVVDATPPTVASSVTDPSLWPPNHNLINLGLAVSRTDNCTSNSTTVQVLVYSDEDDEEETGDGNHSPDAKDLAPGSLRLRSERKGDGDGRVYLIVVKVTDAAGNVGFACSTVVVPKSQSQANKDAVNAQAAAAKAYFQSNGAPPSGYFVVGDGPVIGPKQ